MGTDRSPDGRFPAPDLAGEAAAIRPRVIDVVTCGPATRCIRGQPDGGFGISSSTGS